MRLAMVQMRMSDCMQENLQKSLTYMEQAGKLGAELVFFPEIQLTPFFPQYEKKDVSGYLLGTDSPEVHALCSKCRELNLYASPNLYLELDGQAYDASLFIGPDGMICGISSMVHIAQAEYFYEQDYYTPSGDGFKIYETPFGKIGIVICFDRHLPESIRTCVLKGAELILIPTANTSAEPMELFEWEIRVQAMQNRVNIAMCNRVGREAAMNFSGESLAAGPDGNLYVKAGAEEGLILADIPMEAPRRYREKGSYPDLLRPEMYF